MNFGACVYFLHNHPCFLVNVFDQNINHIIFIVPDFTLSISIKVNTIAHIIKNYTLEEIDLRKNTSRYWYYSGQTLSICKIKFERLTHCIANQ